MVDETKEVEIMVAYYDEKGKTVTFHFSNRERKEANTIATKICLMAYDIKECRDNDILFDVPNIDEYFYFLHLLKTLQKEYETVGIYT